MSVRLVRGHRGARHLVTRRVRSVAVSMSAVTVPVGGMRLSVAVAGVSCISPDVCSVGQGLHIDRSIAESDSRG